VDKTEYPQAIADLLGLPPIRGIGGPWLSRNGTVLGDWLRAVGEALDVPWAGEKVRMMQRLVEAVGGTWDAGLMASTASTSGGGGNITTRGFEALLEGLQQQRTAGQRRQVNEGAPTFAPRSPSPVDDSVSLRAIRARRGQPQFRADLLVAYEHRCAATACDAPAALEAAHIVPFGDGGTYEVVNGLLLRADVHTLFDLHLWSVDSDLRLVLHPELKGTVYESELGASLRPPPRPGDRPSGEALQRHRVRCDF